MTNFLVIFFCLIAGWLCQKAPRFPKDTGRVLNAFVIYISLPALVLIQFPLLLQTASINLSLLLLAAMPWIVFALSWLLFTVLGAKLGWKRATIAAVILTAGLGNTSFVGFPLLEALIGPEAIRFGVVVDQFGSFLVLSLVGIPLAASFAGERAGAGMIAQRVLAFPPFLAVIAACLWFAAGLPFQNTLNPALEKVAGSLVPLALFAVGFQLKADLHLLSRRKVPLALGLTYKLLIAPLLFYSLYLWQPGMGEMTAQVLVLQAGMAPMITAAIVASELDLDPEIAGLMVAIGIPLSLITVPVLHLVF